MRNSGRRRGHQAKDVTPGGHAVRQSVVVGHVHPNPPKSVHNPIRAIDPHSARKVRMEDYVRRHASGEPK